MLFSVEGVRLDVLLLEGLANLIGTGMHQLLVEHGTSVLGDGTGRLGDQEVFRAEISSGRGLFSGRVEYLMIGVITRLVSGNRSTDFVQ